MLRLSIKLCILSLLVLVCICIASGVSLWVGDMYPVSYVAQLQTEDRLIAYDLIGSRSKHIDYKIESIISHNPELLILGPSRAWHFSDYHANRCPSRFYNGSFLAATISEIELLLRHTTEQGQIPKTILISLDYVDYNGDSDYLSNEITTLDKLSTWDQVSDNIRRAIVHVTKNPAIIIDILSNLDPPKQLGWGFYEPSTLNYYEGDGSFIDEQINREYADYHVSLHKGELEERVGKFYPGATVNTNSLTSLEAVLNIAKEHQIDLIGFFPPYHGDIWRELASDDRYTFIPEAYNQVSDMFDRYGFSIYDFSDVTTVGGNNSELYDSWHSSELLTTRMYLELLRNEQDALSKYSDIDHIEDIIENATDPFWLDIDRSQYLSNQDCSNTP